MNPDLTTAMAATGGLSENGMMDKMKNMVGNLYLEPLDPRSDYPSLTDRARLVWQSARPWNEFLNLNALNLPPLAEVMGRMGKNLETYFYNYFLLGCLHLVFFAIGHFWTFVFVTLWIGLTVYLLVISDNEIDVRGHEIDEKKKLIIVGISGVLLVIFGHGLTMVISLTMFLLIVVGIHSIIRDNTLDAENGNV